MELIRDLGEQGLLSLIQPYCLPNSIGDDGAIIDVPKHHQLIVTTDVLVDGVHFSDRTTTPVDVGWRSIAANLSDLAAMGASPIGITVGLSLPPELSVVWLEQLYAGMQACSSKYDTGVIGGDLTRSTVTTVAITALGKVKPERVIRRNTAKPGDSIVITGYHGNSHGGLKLLLDPQLGENLNQVDRQTLITAHQRPNPRLDLIPILDELRQTANQISGMDSSDGLADAIVQICRASGVGAIIESHQISLAPALVKMSAVTALESALSGGEDFELVLCMPESIASVLVDRLGAGAAIIGRITQQPEILLVDVEDRSTTINLDLQSGFQHF